MLEAGKSYNNLRIPNISCSCREKIRFHVDYILDNKKSPGVKDARLVVYRVWFKHKKYWNYYVEPYYIFAIVNDWDYSVNEEDEK